MPFRIASFSLFDLLNIVGADADVVFDGGPFGGKSINGCAAGLARFEPEVGVPLNSRCLRPPELELDSELNAELILVARLVWVRVTVREDVFGVLLCWTSSEAAVKVRVKSC